MMDRRRFLLTSLAGALAAPLAGGRSRLGRCSVSVLFCPERLNPFLQEVPPVKPSGCTSDCRSWAGSTDGNSSGSNGPMVIVLIVCPTWPPS
jgi:hypothetical protein